MNNTNIELDQSNSGSPYGINIMEKLFAFRAKNISMTKDTDNPFYKSKYVTLTSLLKELNPIFQEMNLSVFHTMKSNSGFFEVTTTIYDLDSCESVSTSFPAFGTKAQEAGSSQTYARRYNLMLLLDIMTDEDDDGNAANSSEKLAGSITNTAPELPWFNDKNLQALSAVISDFLSVDDVIASASKKYKLSKQAKIAIERLFLTGEVTSVFSKKD